MKLLLASLSLLIATSAFAANAELPYCRTVASGYDKSQNLFFAELLAKDMTHFQYEDFNLYYVTAVNGGQSFIDENAEIAARASDASGTEYGGHANGSLANNAVLMLDLHTGGTTHKEDGSRQINNNVCFGSMEAVVIYCSFDKTKVDQLVERLVNVGGGIGNTLPTCR